MLWTVAPPGSSVHGILQARILEWVAMPSSRGSPPPTDWTWVFCISCIAHGFFTAEPLGKPDKTTGIWKFPGGPGVSGLRVQVQSLVRELRSHKLWGTKEKEEKGKKRQASTLDGGRGILCCEAEKDDVFMRFLIKESELKIWGKDMLGQIKGRTMSKVTQGQSAIAEDLAGATDLWVPLRPSICWATLPGIEFLWMAWLLMKILPQMAETKPITEVQRTVSTNTMSR